MNQFTSTIIAIFFLTLVGCSQAKTSSTQQSESIPVIGESSAQNLSPSPVQSTVTRSPQPEPSSANEGVTPWNSPVSIDNKTITAKSIGVAQVGMTLGQLKQILNGKAEFKTESPFIVDFDAIAVIQGGKTQYYILYPAGSPMRDIDIIEALVTDNSNYKTAEGISPGTSIEKAKTVYGEATLSYNQMNESREYVKFSQQPSKDMAFRLGAGNDDTLSGIYPSPQKEFNQTKEFKKNAKIGFIEVYCGANCPPQPLP